MPGDLPEGLRFAYSAAAPRFGIASFKTTPMRKEPPLLLFRKLSVFENCDFIQNSSISGWRHIDWDGSPHLYQLSVCRQLRRLWGAVPSVAAIPSSVIATSVDNLAMYGEAPSMFISKSRISNCVIAGNYADQRRRLYLELTDNTQS